uniref:TatD related DNase n=2 Tax=Hyaloperonospora arabidopsidis TaxID=272952 RepID=M4B6D3_HYAAE|nr:TatD related DNase [Hyaloperonospora arabidopsidis]
MSFGSHELFTNVWYYVDEATRTQKLSAISYEPKADHPKKVQNVQSECIRDVDLELIDFDCNLTHQDLQHNIESLMQQAASVGVKEMLVPGASIEESQRAIELCSQHPTKLFPTAGVHPYNAQAMPKVEELTTLQDLLKLEQVRAVGECGLDYSPSFPEREYQRNWFAEQLAMACALRKPLFLHERQAHHDFIELIDAATRNCDGYFPPAVVHCFTGSEEELKAYVARGDEWYIGITGFICKPQGAALKKMLKHVPLDRLVLETDAPYMGFPKCRRAELTGRNKQYPNVPSAIPLVAQTVASALGLSPQEVARITRANARRFLRL